MNEEIIKMANAITKWSHSLLLDWGISFESASYINMLLFLVIAGLLIYVSLYVAKKIIHLLFNNLSKVSKLTFFIFLNRNKFPSLAGLLVPYLLMKILVPIVFHDFPIWIKTGNIVVEIWLIFLIINIIISVIRSACDMLVLRPAFRDKPMTSYIQVLQIILYILGLVIAFSIATGKSPVVFFTAMGAASAVLLLMFQDSIKGFVASIQVTTNDMVRLGDWITVPKYGADGDVIEINLTTVKVQNFDKTITTLPTYALIADSFQNWRGMENASGRRIKRSLFIKQSSIHFIDSEKLSHYKKIQGISKYIDRRQEEIEKHNVSIGADRTIPVNGRNLTNAGLFRVYTEWYLKTHPDTKKEYTMMVRQLNPTATGIPFEIYVFTNTTNWVKYEAIMSDIFDHLIAAVKYFDLQIFEMESGGDVKQVKMI
ncbi:MAG: mechanosensitive ion channel family protein [Dysgonamonadaceae bacterium]|jgi:miniconductance mechanosensitive channel|nr:mechanosensitive ion channel family protein [Dysgonamonadaceae bacterium]